MNPPSILLRLVNIGIGDLVHVVANLLHLLGVLLDLILLSPDQHLSVSLVGLIHIELDVIFAFRKYHMSTDEAQHLQVGNNLRRVLVGVQEVLHTRSELVDILHLQRGDGVDVNRHQVVYA